MRSIVAFLLVASATFAQDSPWEVRILPAEDEWAITSAYALNDHGDVVGTYSVDPYPGAVLHPILWTSGGYVILSDAFGYPGDRSEGYAGDITNSGLIGGSTRGGSSPVNVTATVWDIAAGTVRSVHPPLQGFTSSNVRRILDDGAAVGTLAVESPAYLPKGYYWGPGTAPGHLLEPLPGRDASEASGLDSGGRVVGWSYDSGTYEGEATVWEPDGRVWSLHAEILAAMAPEDAQRMLHTAASQIEEDGTISGGANDATYALRLTWSRAPDGQVTFLDDGGTGIAGAPAIHGGLAAGAIGNASIQGDRQAAFWFDGILHVLPRPSGFASTTFWDGNRHGIAVGDAVLAGNTWWWQGGRAIMAVPRDEGDFDGDALEDKWELQGYDHDNGSHVDLPSMGANPLRRDLFVEIDAMAGHRPDVETLQPVIDSFKAHDIALHIHIDEDLPFDAELGTLDGLERYQWEEFDALKSAHFAEELESAVRYCVFGHRLATLTDSGLARGEPSSDFIVSLGAFVEESGSTDPWMQAGTFMHELGHTLGLQHGGGDPTNRKPNYLSVMNYDFQKQGLRIGGQDGNFDYSPVLLAALNETALDESAGLGAPAAGFQTLYRIVTIDPLTFDEVVVAVWSGDAQGSIDWDGDTLIDAAPVSADINADGTKGDLTGHDDWAALDFNGGTVGFGVGIPPPPPPPETEVVEELTVEEAKVIPPPPVEGLAARAGRRGVRLSWTPVGPYGQGTYRVYRWSGPDDRVLVKETQASLTSDNPGSGTWYYAVTVVDSLGAESLDSKGLRVQVR